MEDNEYKIEEVNRISSTSMMRSSPPIIKKNELFKKKDYSPIPVPIIPSQLPDMTEVAKPI
jgi:hypothetical protein